MDIRFGNRLPSLSFVFLHFGIGKAFIGFPYKSLNTSCAIVIFSSLIDFARDNIYSCRKIEKLLLRDIRYIWLSGNEHPDFITINRFRNRVKEEINTVFTLLVLVLASKGFISFDKIISTVPRLSPGPTNILLSGARQSKRIGQS